MFVSETDQNLLIVEVFNLLSIQNHFIQKLRAQCDLSATTLSIIDLQGQIEEALSLIKLLKSDSSVFLTRH